MEKELERRIFYLDEYDNKIKMGEAIKEYISKLKNKYPSATITKEFYKGNNILVRATEINVLKKNNEYQNKKEELEQDGIERVRGGR